jgi:methyl-accepting chemotaxis protein
MHPIQKQWEGKDLSDYTGPDGKKLFMNVVQIAQTNGEGFIDYVWAKPDKLDKGFYPKISFVKLYQPWRWIIGTGVYIEDINAAFWNAVLVACGLVMAVLMFLLALAVAVSESS